MREDFRRRLYDARMQLDARSLSAGDIFHRMVSQQILSDQPIDDLWIQRAVRVSLDTIRQLDARNKTPHEELP